MNPREKKEFLFLESVGFIGAGKTNEDFLNNLRVAAITYKRETYEMKNYLEKKYPGKRFVKKGLNWHEID